MRQSYPSDISREQFELIKADLESAKKCTKPRKIDLYDVFCAILVAKQHYQNSVAKTKFSGAVNPFIVF